MEMLPAVGTDKSATVLWFPENRRPKTINFDPSDPILRAKPFWYYHESLMEVVDTLNFASEDTKLKGHCVWIKWGDKILDESDIRAERARLEQSRNPSFSEQG